MRPYRTTRAQSAATSARRRDVVPQATRSRDTALLDRTSDFVSCAKCVRRVAQRDPRSRLHARALRTRTCAASLWSAVVGVVTAARRQSLRLTCCRRRIPPVQTDPLSAVRPYAAAFVHALHPVHSVSLGASAVAVNVAVKRPAGGPSVAVRGPILSVEWW